MREELEYIIHCDEQWKVIWPISKSHAHLKWVRETICHYSTRSMVYNPVSKKYGIQLKNPKKHDSSTWWRWDMWVAWHNCYVKEGDKYRYLDFEENLQKEAEEEIGIHVNMFEKLEKFANECKSMKSWSVWYIFDKFLYDTWFNKERVWLWFIATCENDLEFTDNEVIDFNRFSSNELLEFMNWDNKICDPLKLVYEKAEKFRKEKLDC